MDKKLAVFLVFTQFRIIEKSRLKKHRHISNSLPMSYEIKTDSIKSWPAACDMTPDINASSFKGNPGAVLQIGKSSTVLETVPARNRLSTKAICAGAEHQAKAL
ncbi:MAG: hypothetical protein ABI162_10365 [Luteolibacter sp.]